jgi:hypothetical protein
MATAVGSAVSGAVGSADAGGAGAATGMGATFMTFLVKPLIAIFTPIAKALALLLTPLGILGVVLTGLAAYFIKKDVERISEILSIKADNDQARARDAESIRSGAVRRTAQARGASISTTEGLTESDRLKSIIVEGSGGQSTNFGEMLATREQDIKNMIEGRGGEAVVSEIQAAQFKNELAQRDVVYLRNAIAAKQSGLVTESRPPTKEETDQLRLLTDMVKYLEKQVGITQGQADDERKKQDEREQFEQIQRLQNLNYQEGGYYQY